MAIAKIKLINLTSKIENLDKVLMELINLDDFHPVPANQIIDKVHGLTSFTTENPFEDVLNEVLEIEKDFNLNLANNDLVRTSADFDLMREFVNSLYNKTKELLTKLKSLEEDIRKYNEAINQLTNLESLDISLDDLFHTKYVTVRLGRIPNDSIERLSYYKTKPFIFKVFNNSDEFSWCMYFTSNEYEIEIDNMFSSLFFERIFIPDLAHGTPGLAKEELMKEVFKKNLIINEIKQEIEVTIQKESARLATIKNEILFLKEISEAKKYVVGMGDRFQISGFCEEKEVDSVKNTFSKIADLEIEVAPANSDKRITPPTKLKNNWFTKPFSMFVEMYGTPKYGRLDPTPIVAITYSLLFGIMFGDLGQGLVLIALGTLLWGLKKLKLGAVIARIGVFSAIFGVIYGEVFGQRWLDGLYNRIGIHPIHTMDPSMTMVIIGGAIGLGALLILISIGINIYQKIREKNYPEMLLSPNGIVGFVFYFSVLLAIVLMMANVVNLLKPYYIIPLLVVPLVLIFLKEPIERKIHGKKMFEKGFLGFFAEGFFELFEVVLSYITNTASFMRVGGFVLSHAGMMLVVNTLMGMFSGFGTVLTAIFGNILVIGIEGLIVGIQVLRLEFYETFSRYYDGGGIPFTPIKVNNK